MGLFGFGTKRSRTRRSSGTRKSSTKSRSKKRATNKNSKSIKPRHIKKSTGLYGKREYDDWGNQQRTETLGFRTKNASYFKYKAWARNEKKPVTLGKRKTIFYKI